MKKKNCHVLTTSLLTKGPWEKRKPEKLKGKLTFKMFAGRKVNVNPGTGAKYLFQHTEKFLRDVFPDKFQIVVIVFIVFMASQLYG